jgi:MFS family permease
VTQQPTRDIYPMDEAVRRRAMNLAIAQGVLGTIGGWLMGGTFLTYFAMELGAKGKMMGIILAVGNIVSLLRLIAPYFVNRSDNRKKVWLCAVIMARLMSIGFPLLAFPQFRPPGVDPLWILVLILCTTTICNAIGDVAWLSWYADIVPENIWGRYFARRNIFCAIPVLVVPMLGGWAVDTYVKAHPDTKLTAYAAIYSVGITFNILALAPLLFVPNLRLRTRPKDSPLWREILVPFRDVNFRRYAYFYGWLMLGSGIPHASFQLYLKNQLEVPLMMFGVFQTVNQIFNMTGQKWAGRLTDRFGNKPIIILGLIGAATGPFFWIPTSKGNYGWILAAYVVWGIGWAGVGLGNQNLMLKIAPRGNNVAYIAAVQALGGICLATFQIIGGLWLDRLTASHYQLSLGFAMLNAFHIFFLLSFIGRSSAALWVFGIREPRSRSIPHIFRALKRTPSLRRARARLANVLLACGTTFVTLFLIESILRLRPTSSIYVNMRSVVQHVATRPHPATQYVNRANYVGTFANLEFRTTIRINKKGLRDKDYPDAKPPGRKRCLVLGDSFAFGWGVEAEETVAKRLEAQLDGVDVINAACSGWGTQQELLFLQQEGIRYQPDGVLLFFSENDALNNLMKYKFVNGKLYDADEPVGRIADCKRWLIRRSAIWNLLSEVRNSLRKTSNASTMQSPSQSEVWAEEEKYLRAMQAFCQQRKMMFAVVYVPGKDANRQPAHADNFSRIESFCARRGIAFLDLVPALREASQKQPIYFRIDDHWNRNGHQAAANAVLTFLRDQRWLSATAYGTNKPSE